MLQDPRDRLWKEDICFRQKYKIISKTYVHLPFRFYPRNASLFPEVYFDPLRQQEIKTVWDTGDIEVPPPAFTENEWELQALRSLNTGD